MLLEAEYVKPKKPVGSWETPWTGLEGKREGVMAKRFLGVALGIGLSLFTIASAQAPKVKLVDCFAKPDAAECQRPNSKNAATLGDGISFYNGGFADKIVGGFVQGNAGIFAVKLADAGMVVSVDLASGDRTLISGAADASNSRGKSAVMYKLARGDEQYPAYTLEGVRDVKLLPNGNYVALVNKDSTSRVLLLEIDAKSGDRKLLWADELAPDTHPGGLRDKEQYDPKRRCLIDDGTPEARRLIPTPYSMALDSSGNVYLALNNNPNGTGFGFARISKGQCELFSYYDFQLNDKTGSGFKIPRQEVGSMALLGSKLYAVHGFGNEASLTSLDTGSAERKLVSAVNRAPNSRRGQGDQGVGYKSIAVGTEGLFSVRVGDGGNGFGMTQVDLTSGNRTALVAKAGPLKAPLSDDEPRVFTIPGSPLLLVSMESALMVFDPKSGNSSVLSY